MKIDMEVEGGKRDLPSPGPLLKYSSRLGMSQTETRGQEFHPDLSRGWEEPCTGVDIKCSPGSLQEAGL